MRNLLTTHFYDSANRYSSKAALKEKVNGAYRTVTYQEMKERVQQVAAYFIATGFAAGERVAILSENRSEWPIADMGMISAGLVNVPIYPTLTAPQIAYILNDSACTAVIVSTRYQLEKIQKIARDCPNLRQIVTLENLPDDWVIEGLAQTTFAAVLTQGEAALAQQAGPLEQRLAAAKEEDLVSIVYTSGTTGNPKGVMLSHQNFASNAKAAGAAVGFDYTHTTLSFLPLSHVLERVVNYVIQYCGATVAYAESIDTLAQNMQEIQPTAFIGVPRVFEKIHSRIIQNIAQEKPLKRKLFQWALEIGEQVADYRIRGLVPPPLLMGKHRLADRLVFEKVRARFGGHLRFAVSGGAPLMKELARFFFAVGIEIYEGYGLTESSPVICINRPHAIRFGSVGQVVDGVEVQIAEDGEILARGPNIMSGYFNHPEASVEALHPDGWLYTGDIGELDEEGFLRITDRKKEIIVMSNGKNVAPQPIENALKASPYIEQAVLVGNNQKYMAALIYPNYPALETLAREQGIQFNQDHDLARSTQMHRLLKSEITQLTETFARYEQIKKFTLLENELTQENGCLTPTLKFKRRVINQKYAEQIAQLFAIASV